MKTALATALGFALLPQLASAAAWTLPENDWQLITSGSYYQTDEFYTAGGDKRSQPEYTRYSLSPYIEYGLQDDLTLGAFGSIDSLEGFSSTRGSNADNTGLSDVSVFARKRLWHNEQAVVSIQPLYKLPSFYSKDDLPRSGTENSDVELRLLGGLNFEAAGQMHYANAEVAYRGRLGDPDDQWLMDATLGLRVDEHWVFMPQLFTTWAVGGAGGGFTQSGADDYDLVKTQLSGLYEFDESWALQGGIYQDVYSRNTGYGTGVVFSLWFRP